MPRKGGDSCAYRQCKSRSGRGISFFRFPKDRKRAEMWIHACNRDDLLQRDVDIVHKYHKICEKHFEHQYLANETARKSLIGEAVPTLFQHSFKRVIIYLPVIESCNMEAGEVLDPNQEILPIPSYSKMQSFQREVTTLSVLDHNKESTIDLNKLMTIEDSSSCQLIPKEEKPTGHEGSSFSRDEHDENRQRGTDSCHNESIKNSKFVISEDSSSCQLTPKKEKSIGNEDSSFIRDDDEKNWERRVDVVEATSKKIIYETESSDVYEYVDNNDEDPWKEFNEWKIKKMESHNNWKLEQREMEENSKSHNSQKYSLPEMISLSSVSFKLEKEDCDSSSVFHSSDYSKEIPQQEHITNEPKVTQQNDICYFAEISNDHKLANADTRALELKSSIEINDNKFSSKNSKVSYLKISPITGEDIALKCYEKNFAQNSTSISPETSSNKGSNTTILQNVANTGLICGSTKIVEVSHRKSRIWDKKDRCVYCNRDITNLSRHLFRNHQDKDSVRKILQLPKGDKTRKEMINLLRKEGNLALIDEDKIRPVQRTRKIYGKESKDNATVDEFMPCPYCKGIYRLKTLRKHSNKCTYNPQVEKSNIASLGQNLLIFKSSRKSFLDTLRLKNEVFSKMHADRASFNGKNDPVVCQYAEDYLRKHKRPHIRYAVSNKVRELGRLLVPLQDIYGIKTMLEAMNTVHYGKVVHAAQIISGYDTTLKTFKVPSLAKHLKTILLSACSSAKTLLLKQNPILSVSNFAESLETVKHFRLLVDEKWKYDIGS